MSVTVSFNNGRAVTMEDIAEALPHCHALEQYACVQRENAVLRTRLRDMANTEGLDWRWYVEMSEQALGDADKAREGS